MGRDKARLRLGGRTLLGHIRLAAESVGVPVRVIRRDLVSRCGPLGGVYTALKTSRAAAELFLACDTPFISAALLKDCLQTFRTEGRPIFAAVDGLAGFPFVLATSALPATERQLKAKRYSLQALASALNARLMPTPSNQLHELFNVNTPAEWEEARARFRQVKAKPARSGTGSHLIPQRRVRQFTASSL